MSGRTRAATDGVEALEAERVFLLRSLDDLDAEHAAGELDDASYARLRSDYVARAAEVERRLRGERTAPADDRPGPSLLRRAAWVGGTAAVAILAAVALAGALGDRRPGQGLTGNSDVRIGGPATEATDARDPYTRRVDRARALLASDPAEALREYAAAAAIDPTAPEPPAYTGWVYALTAQRVEGAERDDLVAAATEHLDRALSLDPDYPDAHAFRGLVALNLLDDPAAAVAPLQRYLQLAPDGPLSGLVRAALARAVAASTTAVPGGAPGTGGAPASGPRTTPG
jgi:tetratricopeptide (TPR) repeat protein